MQTTYIVSHQRPPQPEMPRLKPISELDHSSRDLPRSSLVVRKKMVSVFVGSLLIVLMVLTSLSVVVDDALAIPWTVCSVQSGISFAQFFEKLKAASIVLFQSYAGKLQQSELSQASIAKSKETPFSAVDKQLLYNYVAPLYTVYRPPACKLRKWLMRNYICSLPDLTYLLLFSHQ